MEMITSYDYSSIKNEELRKITNIIRNSCTAITGYTFKIAALVVKVEENDLYIEDGFSDIVDYVKRCFGFEKSTTYNMLKIGRFFIDYYQERDVYETALKHEAGNDFSISQVIKMLPLGIEKAKELTYDDVITPDMSCRQIERVVKANLNRMVDPDEDDEEIENDPEGIEDHDPLEVEAAELQKAYNKGFNDCRQAVLDLCDSKDPDYKVIHFKEDVECLPPVKPQDLLTEEDYIELNDRFGDYVVFVVRDMISGKGERWIKNNPQA